MRGHAFIAEMSANSFGEYATAFAIEHMQPLSAAAAERVRTGSHPDFLQIYPDGNAVKIGQVRELIAEAAQKPYEGGMRLIAIHAADSMTAQAQNALLKSLEEPNGSTIFLLLCESAERLLPTVRSRCALLRGQAGDRLQAALAAGADAQTADIIAAIAGDEPQAARLAESAVSGEGEWTVRQNALKLIDSLQKGGSPAALAKDMPEDRQEMKQAVSALLCYFSDAMRQGAGYDRIINRDFTATAGFWRGRSPRQAAQCVGLCNRANSMLDSNVSAKLCASWLFINISEAIA